MHGGRNSSRNMDQISDKTTEVRVSASKNEATVERMSCYIALQAIHVKLHSTLQISSPLFGLSPNSTDQQDATVICTAIFDMTFVIGH